MLRYEQYHLHGEWLPPLGDHLAELTNELDDNDWIVTFVSAGPKNYAYKTHQGKTCCKKRDSLIVRVRVVPRRTVVGDIDRRFDNLSGSHHQSHVNCVSSVYGIYISGQLSRDVIGCFKSNRWLSRDVIGCGD